MTKTPARLLHAVLGRRPFAVFALVTGLIVFLLAAITVTSRHAMQRYVTDQIERVPWDISVYQTAEIGLSSKLAEVISKVEGVTQTQRLYFLRTILPYTTKPEIDGEQIRSPWISFLSPTDPSMLPPDIRPSGHGAVLVLVGSKAQMGDAYLRLQNKKQFRLVVDRKDLSDDEDDDHVHHEADDAHGGEAHTHAHHQKKKGYIIVETPIERVIRVDSNEINRWYMEQTSSPTLVPELGLILVTPYNAKRLDDFDAISRGIIHVHDHADVHADPGKYFPEVIHLARIDRNHLVSGWDIDGSLTRIVRTGSLITDHVQDMTQSAAVDHNLGAMFIRMADIARKIALIALLVSLPLLIIAGILLGNLASLLLLNERRKLGLLRLRGVKSADIARSLLTAIGAGGIFGGVLGAFLGSILPMWLYMGRLPTLDLASKVQEPIYLGAFLVIGIIIALMSGRRLVREASRVSPLEASRRVATFEAHASSTHFGILQALALAVGLIKLAGWMSGWSLSDVISGPWLFETDRALDFVAFPLLVYGFVSLIASREMLMARLMAPATYVLAGPLRVASLKHMGIRRHRAASFLLIVAMLSTLALYPTVMTAVFDNKTERGARAQLGSDLQITLNALDLMPADAQSRGGMKQRLAVLNEQLLPLLEKLKTQPGVKSVNYMVEGITEGVYMPDRGFSGLPIYLLGDAQAYRAAVRAEQGLGESENFDPLMARLPHDEILASSSVTKFYKRAIGGPMPIGRNVAQQMERAPFGGSLRFLPGLPLKTVNDREGFISARVDYLNHLFASSPYLVASANNKNFDNLDILLPRIVVMIAAKENITADMLRQRVTDVIGMTPLDIRDAQTEIARLGSDMFIFLARQNVQIYLFGGLILAFIGIFAVAYANYVEDRRTLGLLRIRGAGPAAVVRFFLPNLIGPSMAGFVIGALVSLAVGFGITKVVWDMRQLQTVMNYLPTQLAVSAETFGVALVLILLVCGIGFAFGRFVFNKTAREGISDGQ
jgi:ABC-type antimicrobial peptide transport system permease subunit